MSPGNNMNQPTMQAPQSGVAVRMYNPGFGDCLLLAFRGEKKGHRDNQTEVYPVYMLIDCGVHHQYPDAKQRMKLIVKDIAEATGSHLHVVVVTHEHTDHMYGFKYAKEIFDDFDIDQLWLSWAENPNDQIAVQLKDHYGMNIRALAGAVSLLEKKNRPLANALQRMLAFEPQEMMAAGERVTQLDYLRTKSIKKLECKEDYRYPQDPPLTLPNVQGVKIYVLGPPRDIDWIKKLEKKSELYPEHAVMDKDTALAAGIFATNGTYSPEGEDEQLIQRSHPFDKAYEITKDELEDKKLKSYFRRNYGFSKRKGHGPEWRRIETDWLGATEQMALKINSKINNTSLVLAIELTETIPHKVLLFAADAQVGNWLSWQELSWPVEGDNDERVVTEDLLRRTVLYKVGHHGSRNATLSHKGLEMMDSPNLVAMIPVNEDWAKKKKHWEHPAEKLLERLKEKTRNRVIRTDKIPNRLQPRKPSHISRREWDVLTKQLDWDRSSDKLWIQYTVTG